MAPNARERELGTIDVVGRHPDVRSETSTANGVVGVIAMPTGATRRGRRAG